MSKANVYTLFLDLDWKLMTLVSQIDRFDASWTAIERKEGASLNLSHTQSSLSFFCVIDDISKPY
ncbi:hypothetical protein CLV32_0934 [Pedobacter duraquae]|uniref:Uncharacterized protein n=1 Tax=Pedobacter duraquae TaxID=425511 RepID=A0A4R6IQM0_9SPHI|nr:hypothetical protein CLV32_0934 [Pedobacter duraquae]